MEERWQFWTASFAGFLVIILIAAFMVNILGILPVFGPLAGGIVAGIFAGKDYQYGAKAGLASGFFGLLAVAADFIFGTGYLKAAAPYPPEMLGIYLFILGIAVFFPILAFIGGAIGGSVRHASLKTD